MTSPDDIALPATTNFGFTRIGTGEGLAKNGYSFGDSDRVTLDDMLQALALHTHSGEPALGDPTDVPTFVANSSGGHLAASTEYFYRVSFVDRFGLETAGSPEGSVTTPDPIAAPTAPAATVETASGTIMPGVYSYLVTYFDAYGGETTPSGAANVQVTNGTTNRIRLNFAALPAGVSGINVYRSRPGQSQWYYVGQLTTTSVFYDDGSPEDQTISVPTTNSTNSANSIDVTIPLGFIPLGCVSWRIYRATDSGGYTGTDLVHDVVESDSDDSVVPRITWTDTGDSLYPGSPRDVGTTLGAGNVLDLNGLTGRLPLSVMARGAQCMSAFAPGVINDGQTVDITESPGDVRPVRLTAFFKTPPASGETVTFTVTSGAQSVQLACSTPASGDPAGYFHTEWPLTDALQRYMSDAPDNADPTNLSSDAPYLTVSDSTQVSLITDDASGSGQSLYLDGQNEWGQLDMGALEAGVYQCFVSIRTNESTTSSDDIQLTVFNTTPSTPVQLAQVDATVSNTIGFTETTALNFTVPPGGCEIGVQVEKATNATQTYEVEYVRYATNVPDLPAGQIVISASVTGTASAADANIGLWF